MKRALFIFWVCFDLFGFQLSNAQQREYGKVWVQGGNEIFTSTFNTPLVANVLVDSLVFKYFSGGHSNICDSAGNLILVSDGFHIYNKELDTIEGGDKIVPPLIYAEQDGWSTYSQTSIFLPVDDGLYYHVTPTASDSEVINHWSLGVALMDLLLYNVVDMKENGGAGKVVKRMVPLLENVKLSKTQMMACRHGNGKDWWLLKQASDTNMVYIFKFTKDSVHGPFIQGFSGHFPGGDQYGQSVFNSDGTKYSTTCRGAAKVFLADFDRCSGVLSNPLEYHVPALSAHNPSDTGLIDSTTEALAFSPNGRFLYVAHVCNIMQLDLLDTNPVTRWHTVAGLDTTWDASQGYSSMYLGPDGKLYIGNIAGTGGQMSVINNPDVKGAGCNFCPRCFRFPPLHYQGNKYYTGVSQPPCMPNYKLGSTPPCGLAEGIEEQENISLIKLYPNPANATVTIEYSKGGRINIVNMLGQLVLNAELPSGSGMKLIDISSLPAGIYGWTYRTKDLKLNGKLVVNH